MALDIDVRLDLPSLNQILSALWARQGMLEGRARRIRDMRLGLGITEASEEEMTLATAIVYCRKAEAHLRAAADLDPDPIDEAKREADRVAS